MPEDDDKYHWWKQIAVDQLSYSINLILTFAIAGLGYCFTLLKDKDFVPSHCAKGTMILSLIALALSAISGFVCNLIRLLDFRATARRAAKHQEAPSQEHIRFLDDTTLASFVISMVSLAIGIGALAATLLLTYGNKL
jgi:hypothetical protein